MKFLVILAVMPSIFVAARIQLINLEPEEAQRYITGQSLDLQYAKKVGTFPLGQGIGRYLEGEPQTFFRNGEPIENPEDYNEDVYEATQFHGQDGLGRAMFGYSDNNQARLEARNANGEVRGSYQYKDPRGKQIVVQYWSDSLGFHQSDNHEHAVPVAVTETYEVRQARLAHQVAWDEAARLAGINPESDDDHEYSQTAEDIENDEPTAEVANQHQSLARYPSLPYDYHISPNSKRTQGIVQNDAVIVEAKALVKKRQVEDEPTEDEEEVEQYDPKGFFYSFEYPVPVIVENEETLKAAPSEHAPDTTENLEDNRTSLKAILTGEQLVAAVHDAQISPKQRLIAEAAA